MGGQNVSRTFDISDKDEVREEFKSWQSEANHEGGHGSYSGHIGIKDGLEFPTFAKPFKNADLAYDWLDMNNDKWGPAQAVPFVTVEKIASASLNLKKRLKATADKLEDALAKMERDFLSAFTNIKSASKSCRHCTSKIVKKHLRPECQVCGSDMYSPTQRKRLTVANKKASDATIALRQWRPQKVKGKGLAYVVGGCCSC